MKARGLPIPEIYEPPPVGASSETKNLDAAATGSSTQGMS